MFSMALVSLLSFFREFTFFAGTFVGALGAIDQLRAAIRAFFIHRFGKKRCFAGRVFVAGVKSAPAAGLLFNNITLFAHRAFNPAFHFNALNAFAFRIAGTAEEFTKSAVFDLHGRAAELAFFISGFTGRHGAIAGERFGAFAVRIAGASIEPAKAPGFYHHGLAAFVANFIGWFFG